MADTGDVNVDTLEAKVREALVHINGRTNFWHDAISALSDLAARAREADDLRWKLDDERQAYEHTVRRRNDYREWGEAQQERAECSEAHEKKLRGDRDRLARRVAELEAALRPFVEEYDFHAADYLAQRVDGEEARVFTARTVDLLIEHQHIARAALAGDGEMPEIDYEQAKADMPEKLAGDGGGA